MHVSGLFSPWQSELTKEDTIDDGRDIAYALHSTGSNVAVTGRTEGRAR